MTNFPINRDYYYSDLKGFADNLISGIVVDCMHAFTDTGFFYKSSAVRKMDTIDVTKFADENPMNKNATNALPALSSTDEEKELVRNSWYYMIPPLSKGVLKINHKRFLFYSVRDLDLEKKEYSVDIEDYMIDSGIWMLNTAYDSLVKYDPKKFICVAPIGMSFGDYCEMALDGEIDDVEFDSFLKNSFKNYGIENFKKLWTVNDSKESISDFVTAIIRVNKELSSDEKPKAKRSSNVNSGIKAVSFDGAETPRKQIIRTLKSGITITSERPPKAPTEDNIRHYKALAWNQRGHVRHYKSGKEVYIKPIVKTRKCLKGSENKNIAQTYIVC